MSSAILGDVGWFLCGEFLEEESSTHLLTYLYNTSKQPDYTIVYLLWFTFFFQLLLAVIIIRERESLYTYRGFPAVSQ